MSLNIKFTSSNRKEITELTNLLKSKGYIETPIPLQELYEFYIDTIEVFDNKFYLKSSNFTLFNIFTINNTTDYIYYQIENIDNFKTIIDLYEPGYTPYVYTDTNSTGGYNQSCNQVVSKIHNSLIDYVYITSDNTPQALDIDYFITKLLPSGNWEFRAIINSNLEYASSNIYSNVKDNSECLDSCPEDNSNTQGFIVYENIEPCKEIFDQMQIGTRLYSPIFGTVTFLGVYDKTIGVECQDMEYFFSKDGKYRPFNKEVKGACCMLWPSSQKHTWEGTIVYTGNESESDTLNVGDVVVGYRKDATLIGKYGGVGVVVGDTEYGCDSIEKYDPMLDLFGN